MFGADLVFDCAGDAYIASGDSDVFNVPVGRNQTEVLLKGLSGPKACRWRRTAWDADKLYVSTTGGDLIYLNNMEKQGGSLLRIDLRCLESKGNSSG